MSEAWTEERQVWAERAPNKIQADLLAAHRRAMELLEKVAYADSSELLAGSDVYLRDAEIDAIRAFVAAWKGEP